MEQHIQSLPLPLWPRYSGRFSFYDPKEIKQYNTVGVMLFLVTSGAYVYYRFRHDRNLRNLAGFLLLNTAASEGYAR